jgi:hypothetical protein
MEFLKVNSIALFLSVTANKYSSIHEFTLNITYRSKLVTKKYTTKYLSWLLHFNLTDRSIFIYQWPKLMKFVSRLKRHIFLKSGRTWDITSMIST